MEIVQERYNRLQEIKDELKKLYEEQTTLLEEHYEEFQDFEVKIIDEEGKEKYFRVYEPEGRFVYNVKYEVGLRAKAQKPLNLAKEG